MATSVNSLIDGLNAYADFAAQIGKGILDAGFTALSNKDALGKSLLSMRKALQEVALEDYKRNWSTAGYAKFGDILRNKDKIGKLSEEVIKHLVNYLGANQGGLFIRKEEGNQVSFELSAAYAYDRKKYITKQIRLGEGLVGACIQEKDTIYMTAVPQDYVRITSGLGEATPRSILIVPLIFNEQVYGAVEMASFKEFLPHQIVFVEKIAQNIASTIASLGGNEQTRRLLEEAQQFSEQLRAQEEEMRQNLEELNATQENHHRLQEELRFQEGLRASEEKLKAQLATLAEAREETERVRQLEQARANERIEAQKKSAEKLVLKFKETENHLKAQILQLTEEINVLKASMN